MSFASATLFDFDGTTPIKQLAAADGLQWLDALDETGSFSFSIPVEEVPTISIGQIVKIAFGPASNSWVFAGLIETLDLQQIGSGSDGIARSWAVSGRGARALLEDALVYNVGASATRSFTTATAGAIMKTLLDEAQTRGALDILTYDFGNVNDSNGDPFTETLTIDEQVGTTLLAVADRHQELAVDCWVDPDLVLHYVNERGTDRTTGANPLVLRVGQSVGELADRVSGPVRNSVLIATGDGGTIFSTQQNAGSVSTYGRRETFLSMAGNGDASVVNLAADHLLSQQANPADGSTIELSDNGPMPYLDFEVGDTVYLSRLDGTRTSYRVRSISCQVDDAGGVVFVPELGTTRPDLTRRLNLALQRIEKQGSSESQLAADVGGGAGFDIGGAIGSTVPEFVYGEVLSFNAGTGTGTVDVDGTTFDFFNGAFVGLEVGDTILAVGSDSVTAGGALIGDADYVVTSLVNRDGAAGFPGGSASYAFVAPNTIPGLPYLSPAQFVMYGAGPGMVWSAGGAASLARVVDYTTPATYTVPRPATTFTSIWGLTNSANGPWVYVAPTLASNGLHVVYNGVGTTYNYGNTTMLGEHGGKIWVWAGQKGGVVDRRIVSISSTGVVTDYTNAALNVLTTTAGTVFGVAGGWGLALWDAGDVLLIPNGTGTIQSYSLTAFPSLPQSTDSRARATMSNTNLFWLSTATGDRDYRRWNFASAITFDHLDILPVGFAHTTIATLGGSTVVVGGTDGNDAVYCTTSGTGTTVTTITASATVMQLATGPTFQVLGKYRTDATTEDYVFGIEL